MTTRAPLLPDTGSLAEWCTATLAAGLPIVLCEACWWWTPAPQRNPDNPRDVRPAPTERPECRSHRGRVKRLVRATARIEVERD